VTAILLQEILLTTKKYEAALKKTTLLSLIICLLAIALFALPPNYGGDDIDILPENIAVLLSSLSPGETAPVWIFFTDRGLNQAEIAAALEQAHNDLPERTLHRRAKGGTPELDEKDLPVNQSYIGSVESNGARIRTITRYFNGLSADLNLEQAMQTASLPFVRSMQPVLTGRRSQPWLKGQFDNPSVDYNYGESYTQLQQINVPAMHDLGLTGEGVLVCLLDTGCNLEHIAFWWMDILATWDFINGDSIIINQPGDHPNQHDHGTFTLSACGGQLEAELYGPAFESTFIVGKTEIVDEEIPIEEDYYVAGLEWADSLGADVVSTSLGYLDWYTFEDLDGNTCVTTIGVDIAVSHGIVCCTAAGNEANTAWGHIIAPADADSVVAVGAVNSEGEIAGFSSPGPTYDGRIKPEVCAMGVNVRCADPDNIMGFTNVGGTSLSTPLVGGVAALLVQAHPNWPPMMVREAMMMTASQSSTPDTIYGWGIVDALAAAQYSYPPEIESQSPEADTVIVFADSINIFTITASDPDLDPLTYIFTVDDSVWLESGSGMFEFVLSEPDTVTIAAIARDLIFFQDEVNWTVIVREQSYVSGNESYSPDDFSLTAYPNPFNPSTVISFELRAASFVELAVYNIQGREVSIVVNEYLSAGAHSVIFNAADLPSGVYLYRLTAEGKETGEKFIKSAKMLLLQ